MAVDWIRYPYTTKMRFYNDSDVLTEVCWYYCQPGAKDLPFYTRFGSGLWGKDHQADWEGVGEAPFQQLKFGKASPCCKLPGIAPTGTPEQFANGVSIDELPIPAGLIPCMSPSPVSGGMRFFGTAKVVNACTLYFSHNLCFTANFSVEVFPGVFTPGGKVVLSAISLSGYGCYWEWTNGVLSIDLFWDAFEGLNGLHFGSWDLNIPHISESFLHYKFSSVSPDGMCMTYVYAGLSFYTYPQVPLTIKVCLDCPDCITSGGFSMSGGATVTRTAASSGRFYLGGTGNASIERVGTGSGRFYLAGTGKAGIPKAATGSGRFWLQGSAGFSLP